MRPTSAWVIRSARRWEDSSRCCRQHAPRSSSPPGWSIHMRAYVAGFLLVIAATWLVRNIVLALAATLPMEVTTIAAVDIAGNVGVSGLAWLAGIAVNVFVVRRLAVSRKRIFRRFFFMVSLGTLGAIAAAVATLIVVPKFAFVVLITAGAAAVPAQAALIALGLLLLNRS